jgi:hypothetical protein
MAALIEIRQLARTAEFEQSQQHAIDRRRRDHFGEPRQLMASATAPVVEPTGRPRATSAVTPELARPPKIREAHGRRSHRPRTFELHPPCSSPSVACVNGGGRSPRDGRLGPRRACGLAGACEPRRRCERLRRGDSGSCAGRTFRFWQPESWTCDIGVVVASRGGRPRFGHRGGDVRGSQLCGVLARITGHSPGPLRLRRGR